MTDFDSDVLHCVNHPDRAAIEHCEVCDKPLCGYCLYYTDDGQRLCREHAQQAQSQGLTIIPPAVYAAGIIPSQARASEEVAAGFFDSPNLQPKGVASKNRVLYQGNNSDLTGLLAVLVSAIGLTAVCGMGICTPVVGLMLSIVALLNAKDAVDPKRTRQQGIIGLVISGAFMFLVLACVGFYVVAIVGAFSSASSNIQPITVPTSSIATNTWSPIATATSSPTPDQRETTPEPSHTPTEDGDNAAFVTPTPGGLIFWFSSGNSP